MTLSSSGKRASNDEPEFMPVTKRLTLLSIDNTSESTCDSDSTPKDNVSLVRCTQSYSSQLSTMSEDFMYLNEMYRSYSPSLTMSQNPIYYEANRVLFEAHQMRILRMQMNLQNCLT